MIDPKNVHYSPQNVVGVYRALQAVAGEEARTPDGQARLVRKFERALLDEGMFVVAEVPADILQVVRGQMPEDN